MDTSLLMLAYGGVGLWPTGGKNMPGPFFMWPEHEGPSDVGGKGHEVIQGYPGGWGDVDTSKPEYGGVGMFKMGG